MDIHNKQIWQQASGNTNRDYSELCLKWGVILNGPGYAGKWPDCQKLLQDDEWSARKITDLRRFCEGMQIGDLVVLRLGTASIMAVGEIVGEYEWREDFGDVDGWDLQHCRRIRWLWRPNGEPMSFDTYALKFGDTTQLLDSPEVEAWLSTLVISEEAIHAPLPGIPQTEMLSAGSLEMSAISEYLYDKGMSSVSINRLLEDIGELIRIAKWYIKRGISPSEHETVAYLVIPLLRSLGWTPQKMAVEWNRIDVALFSDLPREDANLAVVVEVKKLNNSCLTAKSQAQEYALDKQNCNRLIVTDGLRYGMYTKNEHGDFHIDAYLNLTRLKSGYPIYGCDGAMEAFLLMSPESNMRDGIKP